jgi:predicted MFS family arabinose efflux permease
VKKLVARMSDLAILLLGGVLLCIGAFALAVLPVWWLFIPTIVVFGMGYFTMHSTLQTRATELSPEARGTAVSLFAFFFFVGQAFGAAALGKLFQAVGFKTGFVAVGLAFLSLALFAWKTFPKKGR